MPRWTPEENLKLSELFFDTPQNELIKEFNRVWQNIRAHAYKLGIKRNPEILREQLREASKKGVKALNCWTDDDKKKLCEIYNVDSKEDIKESFPGRTWSAIRLQAVALKLTRNKEQRQKERIETLKKNNIEKYGVESTFQLDGIKEKSKRTNLKKRGVEYPTQSTTVRDLVKKSVQSKYGVDNVFQLDSVKEKTTQTLKNKFGVEHPLQNPEILKKVYDTNTDRYGVENPFQMVDRVQQGMIEKYGVPHPQQVPEIKRRTEQTNLERYGFIRPCQNPDIKKRLSEIGKTDEVKLKKYLTRKKNNNHGRSTEEDMFLNYLLEADPGTKPQQLHPTIKHVIDYYMPLYGLYVQYDGVYWHGKIETNGDRHSERIEQIKESDKYQNEMIPNLVRFWSDTVDEAIKNGSIKNLIAEKIENKLKALPPICHQYKKRLEWLSDDLESLPFNPYEIKASEFDLNIEPRTRELEEFICRYEWKRNIGESPKWCFTARYRGYLGGVILVGEPTQYSKILGKDTKIYEAEIHRGAAASWTPKNLSSRLVMYTCRWMVKNTSKRAFTGYADPSAEERGTIYKACNFELMKGKFGGSYLCRHPIKDKLFSPQSLRKTSVFKKWCRDNGIEIKKEWFKENGYKNLETIPPEIKRAWYDWGLKIIHESERISIPKKSKYVMVLGKDRREQRELNDKKTYEIEAYGTPLKPLKKASPISGTTASRVTSAKTKFLQDNRGKMSRIEMAKALNETPRWVKRQLGLMTKA